MTALVSSWGAGLVALQAPDREGRFEDVVLGFDTVEEYRDNAPLHFSATIGRERALERAIKPLRHAYDVILLDTPPSLGLLTINAMVAAQGVIVPVQCEYLSLRGLAQLQATLEQVRENLNPDVRIMGIVPTMYDGRTVHGREAVDVLQQSFGDIVFDVRIGKTIRFAEAPVRGRSVLSYDPDGQAARWYRQLAREVITRELSPELQEVRA